MNAGRFVVLCGCCDQQPGAGFDRCPDCYDLVQLRAATRGGYVHRVRDFDNCATTRNVERTEA